MRAKFYFLPPLSMIARCETSPASTQKIDYGSPLDATKMTPEQIEAARQHGIDDTRMRIATENLQRGFHTNILQEVFSDKITQ